MYILKKSGGSKTRDKRCLDFFNLFFSTWSFQKHLCIQLFFLNKLSRGKVITFLSPPVFFPLIFEKDTCEQV